MPQHTRLGWEEYYSSIAQVVSSRSSCLRRKVGALIVMENRIISTGYNGTPFGVQNCDEGGCPRCASEQPSLAGYDWCLCVHAEQNAIALAARQGTSTNGAHLYATLRPCFGCLKEAIQAGIRVITYADHIEYAEELEVFYQSLLHDSGVTMHHFPWPPAEA